MGRGFSISSVELRAARVARSLHGEIDFPFAAQRIRGWENVCGDICSLGAALPLHLSKSHRKHQGLLQPPSKSTTAPIQIAVLTLLAVYAFL